MSATVFERLLGASGASQDLTRRYADDARIFPSRLARVALAARTSSTDMEERMSWAVVAPTPVTPIS